MTLGGWSRQAKREAKSMRQEWAAQLSQQSLVECLKQRLGASTPSDAAAPIYRDNGLSITCDPSRDAYFVDDGHTRLRVDALTGGYQQVSRERADSNLEWLDRRVLEMRVRL